MEKYKEIEIGEVQVGDTVEFFGMDMSIIAVDHQPLRSTIAYICGGSKSQIFHAEIPAFGTVMKVMF